MRPAFLVASIVVALAVCAGAGLAWNRVLWRIGWFQGPPAMARGMPPQVGPVTGAWSYRLRQAFPVGSSETKMTARLRREGFEVDADRRQAAYGWAAYPCVYTLTVAWRADPSRRVRDIQGGLRNACTDPSKMIPERPFRRGRPEAEPRAPRLVPGGQSA